MTDQDKPTSEQTSDALAVESVFTIHADQLRAKRRIRELLDRGAGITISLGGIGIIATLLLLLIYLVYVVQPLFESAQIQRLTSFQLSPSAASAEPLYLAIEEQAELGMRLSSSGRASFFSLEDGALVSAEQISIPAGAQITQFALASEESGLIALGLDSGAVHLFSTDYEISFSTPDNVRRITPRISYPLGREPVFIAPDAMQAVAVAQTNDTIVIAAIAESGELSLARATRQSNLLTLLDPSSDTDYQLEFTRSELGLLDTDWLFIDGDQRWVLAISGQRMVSATAIDEVFSASATVQFSDRLALLTESIHDVRFLLGGLSLLVADANGDIGQWFFSVSEAGLALRRVRNFAGGGVPLLALTVEQRQKNLAAVDEGGVLRLFNTTAERNLIEQQLDDVPVRAMAISPRGDRLLTETSSGQLTSWSVTNPHPEISWSALWERVWYEGYAEPDYIWQSSSAGNAFEPKYSLTPLTFGTLKAAFYAMLLAAPLAVCGAIFTGYFMAPQMRRKVKPLVELMEALPTVVLGFLAGLWLAPFVENNLLGIFALIVLLPVSIFAMSAAWVFLPKTIRHSIPVGWEAAILVPVIILSSAIALWIAPPLEMLWFGGDMQAWLSNEFGLAYDQRNAMIVGFAMGFAVIPTIFSIAEDAVFTVPRQLSNGSLALGATPWQTLVKVVLPMASPGIFSALMIGMGRAVGETMIVLMATGNTPIMDVNIFEGMRTLAANIAVEVPESEVGSSHYRILFLSALVLFAFTFVVNTVAELVRQRLRTRYSLL